jgi:predicted nucleic acid-binding protein
LDTSIFIAGETGRALDESRLPEESAISVVTLAELRVGVLAAPDTAIRARRLATLDATSDIEALPIDEDVAAVWARLRVGLAEAGLRINVNDLWIAATAVANDLPVFTQDADFSPLEQVGDISVVRI